MMIETKSPLMMGAVLRETRTAQNIPAEILANIVHASPVTLRKLEQGNVTEAIEMLFSVMDELGIKMHLELPSGIKIKDINHIKTVRRTRTI